jgi:hypothetical protein
LLISIVEGWTSATEYGPRNDLISLGPFLLGKLSQPRGPSLVREQTAKSNILKISQSLWHQQFTVDEASWRARLILKSPRVRTN